jgi:uncharacterized protein (DUF924 family)
MMEAVDVLEFWFGAEGTPPLANAPSWFKKDPAFDGEIRERFGSTLQRAVRGELEAWKDTPRGRLAFIVLLDQFSRNAYRDTPAMFAQDALALEASLLGQRLGQDLSLSTVERLFFYLPMMHAEDLVLQRRCLERYAQLLAEAPEDLQKHCSNSLEFAKKHLAFIERFGRFPHRNAILSRSSTPEEVAFLAQPGSSF